MMDDVMPVVSDFPVFFIGMAGECVDDLLVTLSWDPTDPYAVTLSVPSPCALVDWVFGRELLWAGLDEPAGAGDVQVFPGEGADLIDEDEVEIRLFERGSGRFARLFFDHADVLGFMRVTRLKFLAAARQFSAAIDESLDSGGAL